MEEKELEEIFIVMRRLTSAVRESKGSTEALNFFIDHQQKIRKYFNDNKLIK